MNPNPNPNRQLTIRAMIVTALVMLALMVGALAILGGDETSQAIGKTLISTPIFVALFALLFLLWRSPQVHSFMTNLTPFSRKEHGTAQGETNLSLEEIWEKLKLPPVRGGWRDDDWRLYAVTLDGYYEASLRRNSRLRSSLSSVRKKVEETSRLEENKEEMKKLLLILEQRKALIATLESNLKDANKALADSEQRCSDLTLTLEQREKALTALRAQCDELESRSSSNTWQEIVDRLTEFHHQQSPSYVKTRNLVRWFGAKIPNKELDAFKASVLAISSPPPSESPPKSSDLEEKRGKSGEGGEDGGGEGGEDENKDEGEDA